MRTPKHFTKFEFSPPATSGRAHEVELLPRTWSLYLSRYFPFLAFAGVDVPSLEAFEISLVGNLWPMASALVKVIRSWLAKIRQVVKRVQGQCAIKIRFDSAWI